MKAVRRATVGLRLGWLPWVVLLAGCLDGYPTDDAPQRVPSEMSAPELIDALNRMSELPHLSPRRSFRLRDGCVLEIKVHKAIGTAGRTRVELAGARTEVRVDEVDEADKSYAMVVVPPDAANEAGFAVVTGGRWADSIYAKTLLMHVQRTCSEAVRPKEPEVGASIPPAGGRAGVVHQRPPDESGAVAGSPGRVPAHRVSLRPTQPIAAAEACDGEPPERA